MDLLGQAPWAPTGIVKGIGEVSPAQGLKVLSKFIEPSVLRNVKIHQNRHRQIWLPEKVSTLAQGDATATLPIRCRFLSISWLPWAYRLPLPSCPCDSFSFSFGVTCLPLFCSCQDVFRPRNHHGGVVQSIGTFEQADTCVGPHTDWDASMDDIGEIPVLLSSSSSSSSSCECEYQIHRQPIRTHSSSS